jgi:hypothetical protein
LQVKPESGPVPVRAGQAVVDVDAVITDVESTQGVSLCGEILLISRYARVSHQKFVHHLGMNPSTDSRQRGDRRDRPTDSTERHNLNGASAHQSG